MINMPGPNQTFSRKLRDFQRNGAKPAKAASSVTADLSSTTTPNPFGSSAQFTEVGYLDQLNQLVPPMVIVAQFFPTVAEIAANGITIEAWFKAESSGALVSVPMATPNGFSMG